MLLSSTSNGFDSIVQLLTVLVIFIFVLVLAILTAKFTAGIQKERMFSQNVQILETFKIAPTKYIQIVKIGEKYFSYVVCKDTVTLLGELSKEDIGGLGEESQPKATVNMNFKEIFEKLKKESK